MQVKKITVGFVVQVFDTDSNRFVNQDFIAGDEVDYEDEQGEAVKESLLEVDGEEAYLPFDMVQPEPARKCVRVEWDPEYHGGEYAKVGRFAYIPHEVIDRLPGDDMDSKLRMAFAALISDPRHVIHYTFDEVFDQHGNEWKDGCAMRCPGCGSRFYIFLGRLGRLLWYRCRDCGINFSRQRRTRTKSGVKSR